MGGAAESGLHDMSTQGDTRTDLELVAAANEGERAAFEALYYRYRDWVFSLACRFGAGEHDACDVLQDTFAYVFGKFPGFALRAQLKTFLYPVVKHLALGRKAKAARTVPLDAADEPADDGPRDPEAERGDLAELVAALPGRQREVVLLRFADGLDLGEIAAALDIPVGTVKSRLHNALATLRKRLGRN
ncbi:MAG: RNA polymerase sigma factor [Kiritimatiellae bacterium]|nr:RNA polymerase sigma factor [Kiritimatiellia bacterium]